MGPDDEDNIQLHHIFSSEAVRGGKGGRENLRVYELLRGRVAQGDQGGPASLRQALSRAELQQNVAGLSP